MRMYAYIHTHTLLYVPVYTGIGSVSVYYLQKVQDSSFKIKNCRKYVSGSMRLYHLKEVEYVSGSMCLYYLKEVEDSVQRKKNASWTTSLRHNKRVA